MVRALTFHSLEQPQSEVANSHRLRMTTILSLLDHSLHSKEDVERVKSRTPRAAASQFLFLLCVADTRTKLEAAHRRHHAYGHGPSVELRAGNLLDNAEGKGSAAEAQKLARDNAELRRAVGGVLIREHLVETGLFLRWGRKREPRSAIRFLDSGWSSNMAPKGPSTGPSGTRRRVVNYLEQRVGQGHSEAARRESLRGPPRIVQTK